MCDIYKTTGNLRTNQIHLIKKLLLVSKSMIMALVTFNNTCKWKQPKCPLVDECINKMWSIHTMEP
jgi:hypothetical protein